MDSKGKPALILCIALAVLVLLSFFGWEELTGGRFKSFDLLADVRGNAQSAITTATDYLDPDMQMLEDPDRYEYIAESDNIAVNSTEDKDEDADTVTMEGIEEAVNYPGESFETETTASNIQPNTLTAHQVANQSPSKKEESAGQQNHATPAMKVGSKIAPYLTDYSADGTNLKKLRSMFAKASNGKTRIAVIGDSYIEGDIFTDEVRSRLQQRFGGSGIGYTPVYSEIPGFRNSVLHSCNDFEALDFRTKAGRKYSLLQGYSFKAQEGAAATFTGTNKIEGAGSWYRSQILLSAPFGGSIKVRTGKDTKAPWETFTFSATDSIKAVVVEGTTSRLAIRGITPGVVIEGVYLDSNTGVLLDNMSIRGYAGIRHDEIDASLVNQSKKYVDYDLIILEFGINALSARQTDYSSYVTKMTSVVNHIKKLYPNAVVMLLGIGDRGEKRNGEIHSMTTVPSMVKAQRDIAARTGALFWDTRQAMGGEDAVKEWSTQKFINKDYVHLSHAGGRKLAEIFVNSLNKALE